MENPEEILHSLEEFSKLKPKDIPRELEDYLCFVAKTGDPVYQWGAVKSLFREKLISVITDFYESCPSVEIPPCPNVEVFNYESMKTFILEKLDTFAAAPFTVQRICELLTTPRKEYNRIDKYMRALEKNILVVSTTEPGNRRSTENGDGIVNGLESEHVPESNNSSNDINVEEMDDTPVWSRIPPEAVSYPPSAEPNVNVDLHPGQASDTIHPAFIADLRGTDASCGSSIDSVITCRPSEEQPFVSIEPVASNSCLREESIQESDVTVTITAIPAAVQKRRDSIEPVVSSEESSNQPTEFSNTVKENTETISSSSSPPPVDTSTETPVVDKLSNESEPLAAEDPSDPITTSSTPSKDQPESCEDDPQPKITEPTHDSLIQIPIISEITSGIIEEETQNRGDAVEESTPHLQDKASLDENDKAPLKEQPETESEETSEISTTVTSTVESLEPQLVSICENSPPVNEETSVSSTDDISNDAADVELKNDLFDPSDEDSRSCEQKICTDDSLVDCIVNSDSNIDTDDAREKQSEPIGLSDVPSFASSSSSHDTMDIDINEDSCQEAPTSDG